MESKVCSRSHGQPPGARSRAMMATDCSNSFAARAGSGASCGAESCAVELCEGRSMHHQFTVRSGTNMDTTIEELPRKETVYSLCHECCPLPIDCRAAGFGVRKFPECLRKPLAEGTKRRLAALALRSLPEDAGVVGEHSVIELADS